MLKIKTNNQKLIRPPYSAIYLVLFLFLFLLALSGCAQQYRADSKEENQVDHKDWLGATCSAGHMGSDKLSAGAEQFEVCQPVIWGAAKNVVRVKHLYISSQPDAYTLKIAHEKGVGLVINLREPTEFTWDENKAAKQAGLDYYNVPISVTGESFDPDSINQISALVTKYKDQKILLHCSSGNRASAWLAIHLAQDHNMQGEAAISLAKQAGLSSPAIESRVKQFYLDNHSQQ
jgi:uncharacterized protein (TIGR01244 family)